VHNCPINALLAQFEAIAPISMYKGRVGDAMLHFEVITTQPIYDMICRYLHFSRICVASLTYQILETWQFLSLKSMARIVLEVLNMCTSLQPGSSKQTVCKQKADERLVWDTACSLCCMNFAWIRLFLSKHKQSPRNEVLM